MQPQPQAQKGLVQIGHSINRLVFAWSSSVYDRKQQTGDEVFRDVVARSTAWLKKKAPVAFPTNDELLLKDWEVEDALQSIKSVASPERNQWSIRFRHSDTTVLHRAWTTEVTVELKDAVCHFHLRLTCSGAHSVVWDAEPTVPAIVKTLASFYQLGESGLKLTPQALNTGEELRSFVSYLESPQRAIPVVLLTEVEPSRSYFSAAKPCGIDPVELQKSLACLAEVYTLPASLRSPFVNAVEKEWSAFNGAVRVYNPELSWDDDLHRHPLVLGEVVRYYRYRELDGDLAFTEFLRDSLFRQNQRSQYRLPFPDLRVVIQARSAFNRTQVRSEAEYNILLEEENAELRENFKAKEQELASWLLEYDSLDRELKSAKELLQKEREKNVALKRGLTKTDRIDPMAEAPTTYLQISDWVSRHFSDSLELHSRAKRELKNAVYQDIGLVCRCLAALAVTYLEMRKTGSEEARRAWETFLLSEHLEISKSISESRLGEDRDSYEVDFKDRRRVLEWHLKTGTSRDQREALRIYFFYDESEQLVVIGWLPSHLETRAT